MEKIPRRTYREILSYISDAEENNDVHALARALELLLMYVDVDD